MTTFESTSGVLDHPGPVFSLSEDQLAAVAFLARYGGRTLEAYRHDLRCLSSGRPITAWPRWRPPEPTWSCTGPKFCVPMPRGSHYSASG